MNPCKPDNPTKEVEANLHPLSKKSMIWLGILLVFYSLNPATILASGSEIWQGYKGVDALPEIDTIPNPFQFFDARNDPDGDGFVTTPQEWETRREEIRDLVQRYWLGYRWETPAESVTGATYHTREPNEIVLGFDWPPFFTATRYNLGEEFRKLADRLMEETVEVREITESGPGEVIKRAGPAGSAEEAEDLAIELWNAGYALPYTFFGSTHYARLVDYTGPITAPPALDRPATHYYVNIERKETNAREKFRIYPTLPDGHQRLQAWGNASASVPIVIDIGSTLSAAQVQVLNQQGYGYVRFNPTDIYADSQSPTPNRDGLYTRLYPYDKDVYEYASGALMAWGWAVSQIITALERPTEYDPASTWGAELGIDPTRTVVIGHSRFGKSAIFAGAFDDRIDIVVASEPGGSGVQSYRYKVEGKIFNFHAYPKADRVYGKTEIPTVSYGGGTSWFPETAGHFVNKDNRLPFDSSDIIALIAPRPFLATTGMDAHWLGNEGAVAAIQAAAEVYEFIGANDEERHNIAIRARQSDHLFYNRDVPFMVAIMDREFKQGPEDRTLHVRDLFPTGDDTLGNISYPDRDYANVSDMTSHPFDINSSYLPWSRPDKYTLWTKQETILAGHPAVIEVHSDAPSVVLILPDKRRITGVPEGEGTFVFRLSEEETPYGRYELRTVGDEKAGKSVFFSAVSLADALRHATSKGDEGEENRLIGFSSRLANDRKDPPIILVDGKPVTLSFTPERFKPEETTLLEYGIQFHDKLFARIANEGWDETKTFHIRNLKFVPIQGFTFELSFGNIYASADNDGKEGAHLFTKPISWNVERYNNGPAEVWPEIPDNLAEKQALLRGEEIVRPDAPPPKPSDFKVEIEKAEFVPDAKSPAIVITFSDALDVREFGIGMDQPAWTTSWDEEGRRLKLTLEHPVVDTDKVHIILFRLMDPEGHLIPGPKYLTVDVPSDDAPSDGGGPKPGDGGGSQPGSGGGSQPEGDSDRQPTVLDADRLPEARDGKRVVELEPGQSTVQIPAELADALDGDALLLRYGRWSLELDGEGLKAMAGTRDEPGDVHLELRMAEAAEEETEAWFRERDFGWGDQVEVRPVGTAFDLALERHAGESSEALAAFPVPVVLSTPVPDDADADLLGIYRVTEDGRLAYVGGELRDGVLSAKVTRPGRYVVLEYGRSYSDISEWHWAYRAIRAASAKHLMNGMPDGSFAPLKEMTRAQFAAMVARALGFEASGGAPFRDVKPGSWYAEAVAAAFEAGIVNGKGTDRFGPDEPVTREETAVIFVRAYERRFGEIPAASGHVYADADRISPWAREAVAKAREIGLMAGKGSDRFDPRGLLTRAEGAQLIVNFISVLLGG